MRYCLIVGTAIALNKNKSTSTLSSLKAGFFFPEDPAFAIS